MTDHASEIAATALEHSERIRLLTQAVDKQRRATQKLSWIVGALVVLGISPWFADWNCHGILIGDSLILERKGIPPIMLAPQTEGLAIHVLGVDESKSSEYLLHSNPGGLSISQSDQVVWRTH